MTMEEDDGLV